LVGAKGSDLMLLSLAKAILDYAHWPSQALTGRMMFDVGQNERHTADTHALNPYAAQTVL
jgi:hypothetical protein